MQKCIVTAKSVSFGPGHRLQLSKAQASIRSHNLNQIDGNIYEVTNQVEFKGGEEFGFDGEVPKALMQMVETDQKMKAEKKKSPADSNKPEKFKAEKKALKIAESNQVDIAQVQGTGHGGLVTKDDVLAFIKARQSPDNTKGEGSPDPDNHGHDDGENAGSNGSGGDGPLPQE